MIGNQKINVFQRKALLSLFTASLACGAQTAIASSSAQATIDWDSFNVQLIDLSAGLNVPVFNWTSQNGSASSNSITDYPYDFQFDFADAPDFSSPLSTNTITSEAQSSSLRSASVLQANAASQPGTLDNDYQAQNSADASASNYGDFGLTGYGLALITASWDVSVTGAQNDEQDYSFASASISSEYFSGEDSAGNYSSSSYAVFSFENGGTFTQNGVFRIAVFSDGVYAVTGSINVDTFASAYSPASPVPVPAAAWLFGSGLGILALTRRKNQNIRLRAA